MSAHEDLAAGLIGGAGALFAAWLAFDAIQEQILAEENHRSRKQAEAKAVATLCITPPIQAAAAAFAEIKRAIRSDGLDQFDAAENVRGLLRKLSLVRGPVLVFLAHLVDDAPRPAPTARQRYQK